MRCCNLIRIASAVRCQHRHKEVTRASIDNEMQLAPRAALRWWT